MPDLTLGPLSFSGGLLTALLAIGAVLAAGSLAARKTGLAVEGKLWAFIVVALAAARMAHVSRYSAAYADAPWSVLDIRDGGFAPWPGVLAGLALAGLLAWRWRAGARPLLAGALAGASVFGALALFALAVPPPAVALPPLSFTRLEGGVLDTASLAGRPVVINLWASWCPPCRREMPAMQRAQRDHPEVVFVFVNQGETREQVGAYLAREKLALANVVSDPGGAAATALKAKGLPTTLFFDRQGRLASRRTGELSAATLAQGLEGLAAPPLRQQAGGGR